MEDVSVRIGANLDNLTQEEHDQLGTLLKKAGFTEAGTGGGELDFVLELEGPGLEVWIGRTRISSTESGGLSMETSA